MPTVIGICGGSGSGKTTLASMLAASMGAGSAVLISQDSYYRDLGHLSMEDREVVNFDHPSSIDWSLFAGHIRKLSRRERVAVPVYDFVTHTRVSGKDVSPADVMVVEGHLIFDSEEIRPLFDLKLFLDAAPDILLLRRLRRDVSERGRSVDSVYEQYLKTVKPMFNEFVQTSRKWADVVLSAESCIEEIFERAVKEVAALTGCQKSKDVYDL